MKEVLDALEDMYSQYCYHGHQFASAGETALDILKKNKRLEDYTIRENGSLEYHHDSTN